MAFMTSTTLDPRLLLSKFLTDFDESYLLVCSIIAIHGLNGHWKDSWTNASTRTFWLEDLLPFQAADTRIFSYGYAADTHGGSPVSKHTISQIAETFVSQLVKRRKFDGVSLLDARESLLLLVVLTGFYYADIRTPHHIHRL
jgi:hypothetical protein